MTVKKYFSPCVVKLITSCQKVTRTLVRRSSSSGQFQVLGKKDLFLSSKLNPCKSTEHEVLGVSSSSGGHPMRSLAQRHTCRSSMKDAYITSSLRRLEEYNANLPRQRVSASCCSWLQTPACACRLNLSCSASSPLVPLLSAADVGKSSWRWLASSLFHSLQPSQPFLADHVF